MKGLSAQRGGGGRHFSPIPAEVGTGCLFGHILLIGPSCITPQHAHFFCPQPLSWLCPCLGSPRLTVEEAAAGASSVQAFSGATAHAVCSVMASGWSVTPQPPSAAASQPVHVRPVQGTDLVLCVLQFPGWRSGSRR